MTDAQLIEQALAARRHAYAPYSRYAVGAALLGENGVVYTGCNVENASYGGTICAERTALVKAVSEGERRFIALAIAGGNAEEKSPLTDYAAPCGICRQTLYEFSPKLRVLIARSPEDYKDLTLRELLPEGFGAAQLEHGHR